MASFIICIVLYILYNFVYQWEMQQEKTRHWARRLDRMERHQWAHRASDWQSDERRNRGHSHTRPYHVQKGAPIRLPQLSCCVAYVGWSVMGMAVAGMCRYRDVWWWLEDLGRTRYKKANVMSNYPRAHNQTLKDPFLDFRRNAVIKWINNKIYYWNKPINDIYIYMYIWL